MTSAESAGQTPPGTGKPFDGAEQPAAGPKPPGSPPQPPTPPSPDAPPFPDVPSAAAAAPRFVSLDVRVSRRLLWVGTAYYPLQNIARVHTLTLEPRRGQAVRTFLKRLLIIATLMTVLGLLAAVGDGIDQLGQESAGSSGYSTLVLLTALCAFGYALFELVRVLCAPALFVLSVETSGPSVAVITCPDHALLRQHSRKIAEAIENPQAEFALRIDSLVFNPHHYYFGDHVNMYGGTGNTGISH